MDDDEIALHERFLKQLMTNEPAIRAYVRTLVPTREDAADVMQGVALVLWKKFAELNEIDDFRKWAFGVARFEALAWLRDKARDRLVLADDVLNVVATESSQFAPELSAQRLALEDCLDKLPEDQRTIVLKAYSVDSTIQDVARRSGRTVAAFYQWLHRVRHRLLECTRRAMRAEGQL